MSIITKEEIRKRIKEGGLSFRPDLDSFQLQNHSIDLRLGFTFMVPKTWHLSAGGRESLDITHFDKKNHEYFDVVELEEGQYFDLLPQEYILVSTLETVKIPNDLIAVLYPRASTNRRGLSLDLSGVVNAGFEGQLITPLRNNTHSQTVRLYPGERICQLVFEELSQTIVPKQGKYHQRDIVTGVALEKSEEIELILGGKIKQLKEKFPI